MVVYPGIQKRYTMRLAKLPLLPMSILTFLMDMTVSSEAQKDIGCLLLLWASDTYMYTKLQ